MHCVYLVEGKSRNSYAGNGVDTQSRLAKLEVENDLAFGSPQRETIAALRAFLNIWSGS